MALSAGSYLVGEDLALPDVATGYGSSTNNVTSTSWAVLPSSTCTATMVNPHSTANLLCEVKLACWASSTSATYMVRVSLEVTGALAVSAGAIGSGLALGHGQTIRALDYTQYDTSFLCELPPGSTSFAVWAYRENAAATCAVNYATVHVVPLYYRF